MPTISANVSKKEYAVIREYANACGETTSNLIRKVVIGNAIWLNGFGGPEEYQCDFLIPDNISGEEDNEIFKNQLNKIRRMMGIEEVDEV